MIVRALFLAVAGAVLLAQGGEMAPPLNTWVKRSPLPDTPPSPRLGYEGTCAWDSVHHVVIRYGGHNQGGGGEQNAEVWTFDPGTARWMLREPNTSPPGICCGQQNVFDPVRGHYIRFPSFSGSHGWQWWREIYLNDSSVWTYDLASNIWRNMRPLPAPRLAPLRCASWDSDNGVVLVFGGEGSREGTLIYDPRANAWAWPKAKTQPEFRSGGNMAYDAARNLMFAPELNAAILEDRPHPPGGLHEQQIWTYRYGEAKAPAAAPPPRSRPQPRIVEDVAVSVLSAKQVDIAWSPSSAKDVVAYQVERAPVEVLTEDELKRLKQQTPPLAEPSVGAIKRIGQFKRLTSASLREPKFSDTTIDLSKREPITGESIYQRNFNAEQFDENGKSYRFAVFAYRVRAVNALGTESGPSPAAFTIPSSPQWLFAKEEGTTCHLKWSANPEKGIKGYRVYRMNGRYDNDPILRLTDDPILGRAHSDTGAGKTSRRYYIVAVDALGQEGGPSAPVWFEREWKRFYEPFVAEWHQ